MKISWQLARMRYRVWGQLWLSMAILQLVGSISAQMSPAEVSCKIAHELQSKRVNVFLVDVRSRSEFVHEHIAGAVDAPLAEIGSRAFPEHQLLIIYCDNRGCPLSARAAAMLLSRGYSNVRVLEGGLAAWKELGYPVEPKPDVERIIRVLPGELLKALDSKRWRVLDARPAREFTAGHVPGAVSIPLEELPTRMALAADREWVVYDRIQERADKAALVLAKHGANVKVLVGGIAVWTAKGYPLEIGK